MPITVSSAMNIRKEPARYMSCERRACQQHRPGGRQRHHDRDHDRAGDELRQQAADIGDEGVERHAQRILHQQPERRQALGAAGDDILLVQLIEQIGAQAPDHAGGAGQADHEDRNPDMRQQRAELGQAPGLVDVLRVDQPADRGAEPDVGEIEHHQREQETRRGQADKTEEGQDVVDEAVLMGRGIDPDREGDDPDEQDRCERDHHGEGQRSPTTSVDRQVVLEGIAQIAEDQPAAPMLEPSQSPNIQCRYCR